MNKTIVQKINRLWSKFCRLDIITLHSNNQLYDLWDPKIQLLIHTQLSGELYTELTLSNSLY
jgi:hypothetical protein